MESQNSIQLRCYEHAALTGLKRRKKVTLFYKHIVPTGLKNGTDVRVEPVRLGNRTIDVNLGIFHDIWSHGSLQMPPLRDSRGLLGHARFVKRTRLGCKPRLPDLGPNLSNIKYKLYSFEADLKTSKHGTNPLFACFHASYFPILMEIRTQVLIPKIAYHFF